MLTTFLKQPLSSLEINLESAYRKDETECVNALIAAIDFSEATLNNIQAIARVLIAEVREHHMEKNGLDAFLYEYDLSSEEGITLMCLAEAFLRIPDNATLDDLIKDKITGPDWKARLGQSGSAWVNAATWGLMLTGKVLTPAEANANKFTQTFKKLLEKTGEPVIRNAIKQGMKILSQQFVMGRTIEEALKRGAKNPLKNYRYSFDMLGEAARTHDDAERYFNAYRDAIIAIGKASTSQDPRKNPGISVKLSALHPRYSLANADKVLETLVTQLTHLALLAKEYSIGFTIDAEESERLTLSLEIIRRIFSNPALENWNGFGLAVQAYQKRAPFVIDWLADLAKKVGRPLMVRLVKGAYWDAEIKRSQEMGLSDYAVYTRKCNTDIAYIACAKKMIEAGRDIFFPQFATHNAYTIGAILTMMGEDTKDFEFQCLHGMGHSLYDLIASENHYNFPCRIYAPVGSHEDLLPYLVRRLLENGANTSFVNRIIDSQLPVDELIAHPTDKIKNLANKSHSHIPLPPNLYGALRKNAKSIDLSDRLQLNALHEKLQSLETKTWEAKPLLGDDSVSSKNITPRESREPHDHARVIGSVIEATSQEIQHALTLADHAFTDWSKTPVNYRADALQRTADLFETHFESLMSLTIREAGKTLSDAIAEVREAIDFCRYYACEANRLFAAPTLLPGPTGEQNTLHLHGRGTVLCISPWNFPFAIFIGQITAALAAGNTVLAKPARQTALIAAEAVRLLHEAGIPKDVLQLLPCSGALLGDILLPDPRIKAVVFTGSTDTAHHINTLLAQRKTAITPLIAETGGQNAMIVDSSALPEQVVQDVLTSAFGSAGQRCSALRVLFLQNEIADKVITLLTGAMAELKIGDPGKIDTDVGPVIDNAEREQLQEHINAMKNNPSHTSRCLYQVPLDATLEKQGNYLAPSLIEINSIQQLTKEHFGPILHIVRYSRDNLTQVLSDIRGTQYGLTLGIHSRVDSVINTIINGLTIGNTYVNRSMTGAVVGVQPFGGEGLSGTGPKAGGPHYLLRLCTERTISINTTATGGNATLMSLAEE